MANLSVNLNVAALLRNRRGHPWPSVIGLGRTALKAGAAGLTVHPRPDERHTKPSDVRDLRHLIDREFPGKELNLEGYPDERFMALANEVRADQVTLVPDDPNQATSDHGWDFAAHSGLLTDVVAELKSGGHRVSLFADAVAHQMASAAKTGTDRVELYTGPYGAAYDDPFDQKLQLKRLQETAAAAHAEGLGLNAGHDLTVSGTTVLIETIPEIEEVSIGHALFCDALTYGMRETVRRYLTACTLKQTALANVGA